MEKEFSAKTISNCHNSFNNSGCSKYNIDNKSLLDINNEFRPHVFNKGWWEGGESTDSQRNDDSSLGLDDNYALADKVIKATEFFLNLTNENFTSVSESIKLLFPQLNSSGVGPHANFSVLQSTNSSDEPGIPDYIRTTSVIFFVVILCLGLIGNIMVNSR